MSTHIQHTEHNQYYFITFTCYKWLSLFDEAVIYKYLPTWFNHLKKNGCLLNGYVIMPNHLHMIVYASEQVKDLNKLIGTSKRFLAYEIVKRLREKGKEDLLKMLSIGVQDNERIKGKKHQVFRLSFDAKRLDMKGVERVLDYIHHNPVSGKWNLVSDFTQFKYSSACYYELGEKPWVEVEDYRAVLEASESLAGDSE